MTATLNSKKIKAALINIFQSTMDQMCNVKSIAHSEKPRENDNLQPP